MHGPLKINGECIEPGTRTTLELPLPRLYTHVPMTMPVQVVRGRREGPRLFISAAMHGDELNGVEIIRRLLKRALLRKLRGTIIAVPIVNVYGVIHHSRYLPDRRDPNRAFPGSDRGSMAGRLAHLFMQNIVANCSHGIDLHTGAIHRANLPHIRAKLDDEETMRLARAFGVPVLIDAQVRDGSLRQSATEQGVSMLLYEAGEALRFDEISIRAGVQGIINVMRALGMLPGLKVYKSSSVEPFIAHGSSWARAPESGILRTFTSLGKRVKKGEVMGVIADPFGDIEVNVLAANGGIVIGKTNLPLVHEGEALFHVASFEDVKEVAEHVESFQIEHAEMPYPVAE